MSGADAACDQASHHKIMSIAEPIANLTSGRLLARNAIWNLIGQLAPMAVGVVAHTAAASSTLVLTFRPAFAGVDRYWLFQPVDLGMGRGADQAWWRTESGAMTSSQSRRWPGHLFFSCCCWGSWVD